MVVSAGLGLAFSRGGGSAWVQAAETQGAGSVRAHTVIGKVQMGRVRPVSVLDQAATRLVFPLAPMSV
jgi:hypothetical protein